MNMLNNYLEFSTLIYFDEIDNYKNNYDLFNENQNIYIILKIPQFRFLSYDNNTIQCRDLLSKKIIEIDVLKLSKLFKKDVLDIYEGKNDRFVNIVFESDTLYNFPIFLFFIDNTYKDLCINDQAKHYMFEILYIGESIGVKEDRNVFNRLISHSTVQRILTDHSYLSENYYDLVFTTCSIKQTAYSEVNNPYDIKSPMSKRQSIKLSEAGLINYFKPEYNVKLKSNFPNEKHTSYNELYKNNYNAIQLELDFENYDISLYTDENSISNTDKFIQGHWIIENNKPTVLGVFNKKNKTN